MSENKGVSIDNSPLINSPVAGRDNITYNLQLTPRKFVETILIIAKNLRHTTIQKKTPDIQKKISYNNLSIKERKIEEYFDYFPAIQEAQEILSHENPKSFEVAILVFRDKYLDETEKYPNGITDIRSNSTTIWQSIKQTLIAENNIQDSQIILTLEVLMCYAFTKCKIFEEPS